jgi:hypothetical protein
VNADDYRGTIRIRKARYGRVRIPLDEDVTQRYRRSRSMSAYVAALCFGVIGFVLAVYWIGAAVSR